MSDFRYPLDVALLAALVPNRGDAFTAFVGLDADDRDDLTLTKIAASATTFGFPLADDGSLHGAVDLGLPEADDPNASVQGMAVFPIAPGQVISADDRIFSKEGFCLGRVVMKHTAPDGSPLFALYENLCVVNVLAGTVIDGTEPLGFLGWYGDFPHLHFAIASPQPVGDDDLSPDAVESAVPPGLQGWNVRRVQVAALDEHWGKMQPGPWFLLNPIEAVRWARGEESVDFPGRPMLSFAVLEQAIHDVDLTGDHPIAAVALAPFASTEFHGSALEVRRLSYGAPPMSASAGSPDEVSALQIGLRGLGYNVGRGGDAKDGVDGVFGAGTQRAVAHFQKHAFADLTAVGLTALPQPPATDGTVDWPTLMALDASLAQAKGVAPLQKVAARAKADAAPEKGTFCDPLVRLISQWEQPWGPTICHDTYTWASAGCHPTCVAIVLRWISEDMPRGSHEAFDFPTAAKDSGAPSSYPTRMCRAFWPELNGKCRSYPSNGDTWVHHEALLERAASALGMSALPQQKGKPPKAANVLSRAREIVAGQSPDQKLALIREKLKDGPVIVLLAHPGHYVVVQGVSDDEKIFVVDPGNVLCRLTGTPPIVHGARRPEPSAWPSAPPDEERTVSAYLKIDARAKYTYREPRSKDPKAPVPTPFTMTFLENVQHVEGVFLEGVALDDVTDDTVGYSEQPAAQHWIFSQLVDAATGQPLFAAWSLKDTSGAVVGSGRTSHDGVVTTQVEVPGTYTLEATPLSIPSKAGAGGPAPHSDEDFTNV